MLFWNLGDNEVISAIKVFFLLFLWEVRMFYRWGCFGTLKSFSLIKLGYTLCLSKSVCTSCPSCPLSWVGWALEGNQLLVLFLKLWGMAYQHWGVNSPVPFLILKQQQLLQAWISKFCLLPYPKKCVFVLFCCSSLNLSWFSSPQPLCSFLMYLNCGALSCMSNCPTFEW